MLDIQFIRDEKDKVKTACQNKNLNPEIVDNVLLADEKRRQLITQVENLRRERNDLNDQLKAKRDEILMQKSIELKSQLADLEPQLKQAQKAFDELMLMIPNVPYDEVPVGKDSAGNQVYKEWGEQPKFDFEPKDHIELGLKLGLFDLDRGAKIAGFRGYFLKNAAARLVLGLMNYTLDKFIAKGYIFMIPPVVDKRMAFVNSGHFPWGQREAYKLEADETDPNNDYFLAGTAEVPLVSYYADEVLNEKDLPIKLVGFSPCFRREIGNYGKDTRGIYRVHEFFKVEQVVLCLADDQESRRWHDQMLAYTEEIHQDLGLHYRVMLMCTGDMGEPQAKKYDIETWMPGRGNYGETASDSIVTDFQARRANIRYRAKDGSLKYPHMLNNTAAASTRLLIAILENYQQKDSSVKVPSVLVPYLGQELLKSDR